MNPQHNLPGRLGAVLSPAHGHMHAHHTKWVTVAIPAKLVRRNRVFSRPEMTFGPAAGDPGGLQMIMKPWQEKSHQVGSRLAVKLP